MRQVIAAWSTSGDSAFERQVPLVFNGERNHRLGSKTEFDVLFLKGLNLLSRRYREKLSTLGYHLHDMERSYRQLKTRYMTLARFGDYEQNCFLRWLVIKDFCGNEPFAHYDADIVFNATPDEIQSDFAGLTFVLQGCPAYAQVSTPAWLESYAGELNRFVEDIEGYSKEAWRQRPLFASTARERNGELWNRRILSSDQDFFQFLTLSGRIPHVDAATVNRACSTAIFKNPICVGADIHLPLPLNYVRLDGVDYLGGRKVAFWHMQADFCDYLGYATLCNQMGGRCRVPWVRADWPLSYTAYRVLKRSRFPYARLPLVRRYFGGQHDLGFLFNDKRFWQKGIFE